MIKSIEGIYRTYGGKLVAPVSVVVQDTAVEPDYTNKYVATVQFMFGDADGEGFDEVAFGPDQIEELIDFLQFCARCAVAFPNGRGGGKRYAYTEQNVPGFDKWVGESEWDDEEDEIVDRPNYDHLPKLEWQNDPMSDYCDQGSFDNVTVKWYDSTGTQFDVAILVDTPDAKLP